MSTYGQKNDTGHWAAIEGFCRPGDYGASKSWGPREGLYLESRIQTLEAQVDLLLHTVESLCAIYKRMSESNAGSQE